MLVRANSSHGSSRRHSFRPGHPDRSNGRLRSAAATLLIAAALGLTACADSVTKHGHHFRETDLQQITPGMSQDQVKFTLGTPTTTSVLGSGNAFYYISSTEAQKSFLLPRETDRQVVAVYFNQAGSVENVANYGIKDGKVFDFISRTTPAPGARDDGLLKQLFRNLGSRQVFGGG
ncbi:MAG: outer membrane protein assembly factor BamE [Hyphomicrobiaceae bacterium]|nr:outer membrane protein assembly factor BamE [Hyphomicrobiaceae bacterium]